MNLEKLKDTARKYEQKEDWRRAIDVYLKAIGEFESGNDPHPDLSLYNRVGDLYMKVNDAAAAVRSYERAADLYTEQGFLNNAIALCGKILRVNPGRFQTYYKLAQIHARKNMLVDAKRNLIEYLERMNQAGQLDAAFDSVKVFADQFSANQEIRMMLIELLRAASRDAEAREQLDKMAQDLEARGDKAGARRTREQMQALEVEGHAAAPAAPPPPRKGGDLVFLDTGVDVPAAPGARTPARPPRGPAPAAPSEPLAPAASTGLSFLDTSAPPAVATPQPAPLEGLELVVPPPAAPPAPEPEPEGAAADVVAAGPVAPLEGLMLEPAAETAGSAASVEGLDLEPTVEAPPLAGDVSPLEGLELPATVELEPVAGLETPLAEAGIAEVGSAEVEPVEALEPGAALGGSGDLGFITGSSDDLVSQLDDVVEPSPAEAEAEVEMAPSLDDVQPLEPVEATDLDLSAADDAALAAFEALGAGSAASDGTGELEVEFGAGEAGTIELGETEAGAAGGLLDFELTPGAELPLAEPEAGLEAAGADEFDVPEHAAEALLEEISTGPELPVEAAAAFDAVDLDEGELAVTPTAASATLSVAELEERILDDPENAELHRQLGEALLLQGETGRAVDEFELALAGYEMDERRDAAEALVDLLITLQPDGVRYYQKRVEYAYRSGERARLLEAYLDLGDALVRLQAEDKAAAVYGRVLEHEPANPRARMALEQLGLLPEEPAAVEEPSVVEEAEAAPEAPAAWAPAAAEPGVEAAGEEELPAGPAVEAVAGPAGSEMADALEEAFGAALVPAEPAAPAEPPPAAPPPAPAPRGIVPPAVPPVAPVAAAPGRPPVPPADPLGFVDLGSLVIEAEGPKDSRMIGQSAEPTGDEDRDFAEMLSQFKKGIEENIELDDYEAHYDLGVAFKEMGLLDEAVAEFQKALRAPEGRLRTSEALGICFFEKQQYPVAEAVLRRAVETLPGGDEEKIGLIYWFGRALEAQQKTAEARTAYERAMAVDIRFMDLGERIHRLTTGRP